MYPPINNLEPVITSLMMHDLELRSYLEGATLLLENKPSQHNKRGRDAKFKDRSTNNNPLSYVYLLLRLGSQQKCNSQGIPKMDEWENLWRNSR
jgi:hypothetical protein